MKFGVFISPTFFWEIGMRKCLSFHFHLLSFPYVFSLFSLLYKSSFLAPPNSSKFCCHLPKWKRSGHGHVLYFICKHLVTLLKIFPWCLSTIFPIIILCFLLLEWVWNQDFNLKMNKKIKFNTVYSNTNRIIYKYGKKIDVIKE